MTQTPDTPSQDLQLRFLLPDAGVRGVVVHLDDTWTAMLGRADYPPAATELLGEAAAAAALFTGHAKVDGRLSVQLRADGAIRTLFAECTAAGTLRGIVRVSEAVAEGRAEPPSRDLRALGDDAVLAITIENPALGNREPMRYQGLVALDAGRLDEAFEGYFRQSEQLPTRLLLACDGQRAAGLMLQKLPGDEGDDDGFQRIGALFDTLGSDELLALAPADVVHRLFHEEAPQLLGEKPLRFACSCSRERVEAMLVSLGEPEARAAVEAGHGEASIHCEFCGQEYRFDVDAVGILFRDAAAELPTAPGIQ
ncbi:Hsp33 family molecular chaperone HslO [Thermomonas carbonis]|uniref:Hsp33 family molecular chaperone HslO n=1 Tax=Thermomonas carbonis TaxID=1463158 RepID=A0A7G9SRB4_9GAMM|nr:Hsp33 family molecular chaperone HslO [Thermomonas carbonis]QNN70389.1 Hsp33 family molecular chaperone HslO [Thermomonas carbonis]GHB99684.1 33 kDa chaperonin [Thermomonas carbonis]